MYLHVKESEYMKPTIKNYIFLHAAFLLYSIIMVYMKWATKFPIASIGFFCRLLRTYRIFIWLCYYLATSH